MSLRKLVLIPLLLLANVAFGWGDSSDELTLVKARTEKAAESLRSHLSQLRPDVLAAARCIAVVSKDDLGWGLGGAALGAGLVSCRTASGEWSAPSYLSLLGLTLGPSVGFMDEDTTLVMSAADAGKAYGASFKIDAGVYAIAGSARAEVSVDTDGCFVLGGPWGRERHCTLAVSDAVGLEAGANVKGVLLRHMNGLLGGGLSGRNSRVYGRGVSVSQILAMPGSAAPSVTRSWTETLASFAD